MISAATHPVQPGPKQAGGPESSQRPAKPPAGSRGKILYVDDDPMAGVILSAWLCEMGYEGTFASCPTDADKLMASSSFDLVLSDIYMPGNCHLEWVEWLLSKESGPPIMLITGTPDLETACRAANLPVAGYLLKPVDFTKLDGIIQGVLRERRRRREYLNVAQEIIALLTACDIEGTMEEGPLVDRLIQLSASFRARTGRVTANHHADEAWRAAVTDTIAVIERTKHNFRSKELGALRQRLRQLLIQSEAA